MSYALEHKHKKLAHAMNSSDHVVAGEPAVHDFLTTAEINLLSSIPGAVALFTANGIQVWSNDDAQSLIGSKVDLVESMHPTHKVETLHALSTAALEQIGKEVTIKLQRANASGEMESRTLTLNCKGFKASEKILPDDFALVTIADVTAHNELATQLAEAKQENEDKNRFFSSMSHELRTPLNAIIGFSELLEGKAPIQLNDEKRLEYASLINGSANHLLGLINDILDLSRLDAGKNEALQEPLDLQASLQNTVRSMMPIAMRKGVDLIVEDTPDLPRLNSDKRALTQILTNVLSNAIKFSHENGVVRAKVIRLRNRVKIIITDQGIGMDTETQSKLGGLFYQSGDVIRGDYGGSGLGLSIVYKLIELLGGKIAISSTPGEGTTVSIMLPFGVEQASPVPSTSNDDVVYLSGVRDQQQTQFAQTSTCLGVKQ